MMEIAVSGSIHEEVLLGTELMKKFGAVDDKLSENWEETEHSYYDLIKPKLVMFFDNGVENRRLPIPMVSVVHEDGVCKFNATYKYQLDMLFWNTRKKWLSFDMHFNLSFGNYYEEKIDMIMAPVLQKCDGIVFSVSCSGQTMHFDVNKKVAKNRTRSSAVVKFIGFLYHVISFCIAVCLIPWFILESILSLFGIYKLQNKEKTFTLRTAKHIQYRVLQLSKIDGKEVSDVLGTIFSVIAFMVGLLLLPWFLLEGVLAYFGITSCDAKGDTSKIFRTILKHANERLKQFSAIKISNQKIKAWLIIRYYNHYKRKPIQPNRVTFISVRRNELSGNFSFVYEKIKNDPSLDIHFILSTKETHQWSIKEIKNFAYSCAVSKVIFLDEFTPQIHYLNIKEETKIIQLWHACGAFKTFGFTRLGKPAGSPQKTRNHRNYDYVTVSSTYCKKCHSEGFGIPDEHVVPTGIARTDVLFDENYRQKVTTEFYQKYPRFQGKKIVLFAPTFRGTVKETAYYPVGMFDVKQVCKKLGEDYAVIIKHHPFVPQVQPIPERYKDRVIDLSNETELNDLLFVADVVITDYSSLVFEASLLKVPMLFYAFDLEEYIIDRDFYFDFGLNVPGKIVYNQNELIEAIVQEDYETERIEPFADMFFDQKDGHATDRIVELFYKALQK
jgi:CDP-glycerol glycerophosphotransferase (TagB/SpsB family)